ncbi:thiol reductant ABC exporter subunit CydC [Lentibacillus cibarius]|uniref:Thiol reductant ABC exporter subunit CydC n=1 Tax=Lentibacillus cibarius TaxID=2583219 RepID=A0A549YK41_9BACI|nr:thiol reductant ABC exporter subunit CydC [Lentibacillus cibarius]TRM12248.1 thiol reductant ABC exporter subunit CydC [Lentibacillus cibarius]
MNDLAIILKAMATEKKDILLSILFGFAAGITAVGLFAASGYLISKAALTPPLYSLIILTSTVKLLGITKAIARYAERYFSHRATFTILSNLRVSFFQKMEPLVPGLFQKYRSGDLLSRVVGDVETLQNFFLRVFYPPIVLAIVFLSTILFTSFFSVYIAVILFIGLLLTVVAMPALFVWRQKKIDQDVRRWRSSLSTQTAEFLNGFRDLTIHQKVETTKQHLIESSNAYISEQKRENMNKLYSESVNTFLSLLVTWFVLAVGAFFISSGQLDGILLAMFVLISLTVFEDAGPMAALPIHLQDSQRAASRLSAVATETAHTAAGRRSTLLTQARSITAQVNDISFTFPGEKRQALKQLNITFPAGSKTAIVGPSGSGKSTLLQLLLGLNQADSGTITLDGIPIEQIDPESIWEHSAVMLQENHFFFGTVRDNLIMAKDGLTDTEMTDVLEKVHLDYLTLDDPVHEKGDNLSGGEKQRLALARAILKKAHLWLLDEPASSVDTLTEQSIYGHLFEQAADDTLIIVSHRLTNLDKMDQIIIMDHGEIVETGTFDELMEQKGYLYEMKQIEKNLL